MKCLLILLAVGAATPAIAQHSGHSASSPPVPSGQEKPVPDPHAGHPMHAPAQPAPAQPDPHAGHDMPPPAKPAQPQADPHAGHRMPTPAKPAQPQADPHAGHPMPATPAAAPPVAPPSPDAANGPAHAADTVFGSDRMAKAREALRRGHGAMTVSKLMIDQLELGVRKGRDTLAWEDVQFWHGGDIDKLWIKSQGEAALGEGVERVEVQALWSHAIGPWFDLQAGIRHDFGPGPDRTHLVLGVQGLAPYWFEIDAAAFVSDKGEISARVEAEHDLRITQQLILQPRAGLDLSLQDVPELGIGAGLSTAEAGLRLRYEFVPEFAPYIGVEYERGFGDTAKFRHIAGEDAGGWSMVFGIRAWF